MTNAERWSKMDAITERMIAAYAKHGVDLLTPREKTLRKLTREEWILSEESDRRDFERIMGDDLEHDSSKRFVPEPHSVEGDFYVVNGECIACGIPHAVAPDLVGWVDEEKQNHCCWIKQPQTDEELGRAFLIFDN